MSMMIESFPRDSAARANVCWRRTFDADCTNAVDVAPGSAASWPRVLTLSISRIACQTAGVPAALWTAIVPLLWLCSVAHAQSAEDVTSDSPFGVRVDAGYMYDNNVNRAPNGQQRLTDQFYSLNASSSRSLPINATSRIVLNGVLGGDLTRFFPKLGRIFGEVGAAFEYRKSAEFYAPTLSLFGRGSAEHFGSEQRSGSRYSVGISALQPITDRIDLFGVLAHSGRNANSSVFDANDNSVQLSLEYSVPSHGTLYLIGEYRLGNVVSTGPQSLVNLDIAQVFAADDAYTNPQLISYRFDARTVIATLGYNLPFESNGSLDLSWRWAQSTPTQSPNFPGASTPRYVDNQFMVVFLKRF
jgi:hypothetical protein